MKITYNPSTDFRNICRRLAGLLLRHARTAKGDGPSLSRNEMAEALAASPTMVQKALCWLKTEGAINIERHRMVLHEKVLAHVAAGCADARVYVLLRTRTGNLAEATALLRRQPGVVMADAVEGQSDVIFEVRASDRESLATLMLRAMAQVEDMTEEIQLLPVRA